MNQCIMCKVCCHLDVPLPGDPFSALVPSFAFGFVCLSSLESLETNSCEQHENRFLCVSMVTPCQESDPPEGLDDHRPKQDE